jgi:hypothetical protein
MVLVVVVVGPVVGLAVAFAVVVLLGYVGRE